MTLRLFGRLILWIQVFIVAAIVLHAPFSVWFGIAAPDYADAMRSWKEIAMGVCFVLVAIWVTRRRKWRVVFDDWIIRIAALYGALHVGLMMWQWQGVSAAGAGMLIDLRYVLFFVLTYVTARFIAPMSARKYIVRAAAVGAVIVIGFAFLQVTILPDDILAHIGYSQYTITPFLTVDLNDSYVRINSTLRGPNPLGAYAGMCLALAVAYAFQRRQTLTINQKILLSVLVLGSISALWVSYSRSAVAAGVIMVLIVMFFATGTRVSRRTWIVGAMVFFALIGGIVAARDSAFVSNVVLHENPDGGSAKKSNDGHVESLQDGTNRMLKQPLGGGIGSTGSASIRGDAPLIIENQYLFIAHESGWAGLGLFFALFGIILRRLYQRRRDWLALGVFASGIGIALIGLLLPVWVDDTVAIVWWALAGTALGAMETATEKKQRNERSRSSAKNSKSNKKAT